MPAKPVFHRVPLMAAPFAPLPTANIRPAGWLRAQLVLQSDAMRDALANRWPDLTDADAWRPPAAEEWPRDIALLAAVLPLGYLLDDAVWTQAARRRLEWAMQTQAEDGCFAPAGEDGEAWCARAALMQLLSQYYTETANKQALVHMLRYAKYAWEKMTEQPLEATASARAGELLLPVLWLYRVTEKKFLLELAKALKAQSVDWTSFCHTMPVKTPMQKQLPWQEMQAGLAAEGGDAGQQYTRLYQQTQALNLATGLKTPGLIAQWSGGIKHAEAFNVGYAKLMRYHGLANGIFSGDELLSGASPAQGTSCAAIAELMTTLEVLLAAQGESTYGDLLERLAYNALPAAYAADMRTRQRLQQPNQINLGAAKHGWYNAQPDAAAFAPDGRPPEDAALHHGFPRFAASLWMATQAGGLAAMAYAPCTVRARVGGATIRIDEETAYPYDGAVTLRVHARGAVRFPLHLRIPDWAQGAELSVNGEAVDCAPGTFAVLEREWQQGDVVCLTLPMRVALSTWYHGSGALSRGPLLLAHAPEKPGLHEWSAERWAYALLPQEETCVHYDPAQVAPFGQGRPLAVEVQAVPLPEWHAKDGDAEAPPIAPIVERGKAVTLPLVPYGSTMLRISQFPIA